MVTLLDTDMSPGQFAGFSDPTSSTTTSALHDLFGLQLSPPKLPPCPQHATHVYTQPPAHTYVVESGGALSPCISPRVFDTSNTLSDWPTGHRSKHRNTRLRKQALDQLIIPEERCIPSFTDSTVIGTNMSPQFHMDSALLDHCMALDECFVVGDECSNGGTLLDYSGELPLPPSAHARIGREEEEEDEGRIVGMSVTKGRGEKRGFEELPQSTRKNEEVSETPPKNLPSEF